jgi:Na+-driven multidrug efflux pump
MWGIAVPLSYFLGIYYGLGLAGVWIAFITDEWLRGIIMYYRWKSRAWESKVLVQKKQRKPVSSYPIKLVKENNR